MSVMAPVPSRIPKHAFVQSWAVSVLFHTVLVSGAIFLLTQSQSPPPNTLFTWNVAMVSPTLSNALMPPTTTRPPTPTPPSSSSVTPTRPQYPSALVQTHSSLQAPTQEVIPTLTPYSATLGATETPRPTPLSEANAPKILSTSSTLQPTEVNELPPATQLATLSPSTAQTKRDYGWLSESILRRVEALKRYPATARVDRAEGTVILLAVINEDGSLGEIKLFQRSGYPSLDEAAVETLKQAGPFSLPRPLGQPRITIKIPMNYRLDS